MQNDKLTAQEAEVLREAVSRNRPHLLPLLAVLDTRRLSADEREDLRSALVDDLLARGMKSDDEANPLGIRLEHLIDRLWHLSEDA